MNRTLSKIDIGILLITAFVGDLVIFSFLGMYWWVFELFTNFYIYYFIWGMVALVYILMRRHHTWSVLPIAVIVVTSLMIVPVYFQGDARVNDAQPQVRVMFYNMWVFNQKYDDIAAYINEQQPDVVVLAEIPPMAYDELQTRLPDYQYYAWEGGISQWGDIAYFARIPINGYEVLDFDTNIPLPILHMSVALSDTSLEIYGVHFSPPINSRLYHARTPQIEGLSRVIGQRNETTLLIGDFNTSPWSRFFALLQDESGLRDSRRGIGIHTSWPDWLPAFMSLPIDHALVSDDVIVVDRFIGPDLGSDHYPLIVDLAVE